MTKLRSIASDFQKCPICNEYGWARSHKCPPTWRIYWLDGEGFHEEPETARGRNQEEAAIAYIQQLDSDTAGEYGFSAGETTPTFLVLSQNEYDTILEQHPDKEPHEIDWCQVTAGMRYRIEGEFVPSYYATKVLLDL